MTDTGPAVPALAWLSVARASQIAGISPRAMQKRAANGKIGARKIADGAAVRWEIDGRELDANFGSRTANQDANRFANCEPIGREPSELFGALERESGREPRTLVRELDASREFLGREIEVELRAQLAREREFSAILKSQLEAVTQSEAQTKAALREALRAMPKQLNAAPLDTATGADVGGVAAPTWAPDREQFKAPDPTTAKKSGAAAPTYGDIADALELDLKAKGEIQQSK